MDSLHFRVEICPFATRPNDEAFSAEARKVYVIEIPQTQIAAGIEGDSTREFVGAAMAKAFAAAFYEELFHSHGVYGTKLNCRAISFPDSVRSAARLAEFRDEFRMWELGEREDDMLQQSNAAAHS